MSALTDYLDRIINRRGYSWDDIVRLTAALREIEALHCWDGEQFCNECGHIWPCKTRRILDRITRSGTEQQMEDPPDTSWVETGPIGRADTGSEQ
jgi:hypothetical protein